MSQHVQEEEELPVADARQARGEAAGLPSLVLGADGFLIAPPLLAVRWVGDQVVESATRVAVVGEHTAERDVVRVPTGRVFHEEVRFGDGPGFRVDLLTEQVDVGLRIDGRADDLAVVPDAHRDVLLGDHEHPAGAAARVVDRTDDPGTPDFGLIARKHEIHHQVDDVAWSEVLARVLVQGLVEPPDQLLEDHPHRGVVDLVRVQVHVLEPLEDLEQEASLVELADGVVEVETLDHLPHVGAEAGDVITQVGCEVLRVGHEFLEVVPRRVVESETGCPAELLVEVLEPAGGQLGLSGEDFLLRGSHERSRVGGGRSRAG